MFFGKNVSLQNVPLLLFLWHIEHKSHKFLMAICGGLYLTRRVFIAG